MHSFSDTSKPATLEAPTDLSSTFTSRFSESSPSLLKYPSLIFSLFSTRFISFPAVGSEQQKNSCFMIEDLGLFSGPANLQMGPAFPTIPTNASGPLDEAFLMNTLDYVKPLRCKEYLAKYRSLICNWLVVSEIKSAISREAFMAMDSMKIEDFTSESQLHEGLESPIASMLKKEVENERSKKRYMFDTIGFLRTSLHEKVHHNIVGKDNVQEAQVLGSRSMPARRFPAQDISDSLRKPSLLELNLFPGSRQSEVPNLGSKPLEGQLTIFYSGAINVYDNVPIDKAQAIMLLASESSLSNPISSKTTALATTATLGHFPSSPSVCKLQADLPVARRRSLQRFFEKRRDRIKNKSSYASIAVNRDVKEEATTDNCLEPNQMLPLPPYPSHIGCFSSPLTAYMA